MTRYRVEVRDSLRGDLVAETEVATEAAAVAWGTPWLAKGCSVLLIPPGYQPPSRPARDPMAGFWRRDDYLHGPDRR